MEKVTLYKLRQRAQRYANIKGVSDEEWNMYINDAIKQYWNIINTVQPDFNLTSSYFYTESGVAQYTFSNLAQTLRKVSCHLDNVETLNSLNRYDLRPFSMSESSYYPLQQYSGTLSGGAPVRYRIWDGVSIVLDPIPQGSFMIVYYYLPIPPELETDSEYINGISGLDVYISSLAAKTVLDSKRISNVYLAEKIASFVEYMTNTANIHEDDEGQRIEDVISKGLNWRW